MTPTTRARVAGAWRAILLNFVFRAGASIVGASALAGVVAPAVAARPNGDGALFEHGAALFIETGLRALPRIVAAGKVELAVAVGIAVVGVFPFAALLHTLVDRTASLGARFRATARHGVRLALLLGVAALAEALFLLVAALAATRVDAPESTPSRAGAALALGMLGVLPCFGVMTVHDLARVAVVARDAGPVDAARRAFRVLRRRPGSIFVAGLVATSASALAAAMGFAAAKWIGLGSNGEIIAVLVAQQAAFIAILTTRAAYFARLIAIDADVG